MSLRRSFQDTFQDNWNSCQPTGGQRTCRLGKEKSPYLFLKGVMHLTFSMILSSQANPLYIRISYNWTTWPSETEISISIRIYKVSVKPKFVHEIEYLGPSVGQPISILLSLTND